MPTKAPNIDSPGAVERMTRSSGTVTPSRKAAIEGLAGKVVKDIEHQIGVTHDIADKVERYARNDSKNRNGRVGL